MRDDFLRDLGDKRVTFVFGSSLLYTFQNPTVSAVGTVYFPIFNVGQNAVLLI